MIGRLSGYSLQIRLQKSFYASAVRRVHVPGYVCRIRNHITSGVLGDFNATRVDLRKAVKETFGGFVEKQWTSLAGAVTRIRTCVPVQVFA